MSSRADRIATGRWDGAFATTRWTEILEAQSEDEPDRLAALGVLLGRYWKPVFCYLRSRGHDREAAKDMTQRFFQEVLLGRGLVQRADRAKGRFRTFLLRALEQYAVDVRRAETAKRRMPEGGLVSLEEIDWLNVPEPIHCRTPAEVFDYAWASALLDHVLAEVEEGCRETGNHVHWDIFRERILQPILHNTEPPSIPQLCKKYRIPERARASHMILTVKRRFRVTLRRHVRQMVDSEEETDEEMAHLVKVFSRSSARS